MRDCTEPKSQPAGPACCLRDCKLSLRMQTDKQDRHHLLILPCTAETAAHASPFCSASFSILHSISRCLSSLFRPCTCMFMNSLIYFLHLPDVTAPPLLYVCLLVSFLLIKWASLQYALPSHCSMVRCLSIGGRECLDSFPCFYQFTSVILYTSTMSSHFSHRILLDSQRDTGSL